MITTFRDCLTNISENTELPATAIQTDTIKTGFTELDEKTGGLLPGEVVLLSRTANMIPHDVYFIHGKN